MFACHDGLEIEMNPFKFRRAVVHAQAQTHNHDVTAPAKLSVSAVLVGHHVRLLPGQRADHRMAT